MKNTLLAGFTLVSILLATATSVRAERAPNFNLKINTTIEEATGEEPTSERTPKRVATNSQQSMRYLRLGVAAYEKGQNVEALQYYVKAIESDSTNAYAFMGAGTILGGSKEGILCMKAARMLFQEQGDREGYGIATKWLQAYAVSE
jgi:cytochrome c-type biogenesis protein CcmH/NrfG